MNKPKPIHQDPYRFPKLQEPIENHVIKRFDKFKQSILIDVTKVMVTQKTGK